MLQLKWYMHGRAGCCVGREVRGGVRGGPRCGATTMARTRRTDYAGDAGAVDVDENIDELSVVIGKALTERLSCTKAERSVDLSIASSLSTVAAGQPSSVLTQTGDGVVRIHPDALASMAPPAPRATFRVERAPAPEKVDSAGKGWYDMVAPTLTPSVRNDLRVLANRAFLDPKRHYKREGRKGWQVPKYFQIGTVVEGAQDFYSARIPRKQRHTTIAGELLADADLRRYMKRKAGVVAALKPSKKKLRPATGRRRRS